MQKSREIVPIETGTLERSGTVTVDEQNLTATISYDTPYAVAVHEDLAMRHDEGRTAKYLERPFNEEADTVKEIIAAQIRRGLS